MQSPAEVFSIWRPVYPPKDQDLRLLVLPSRARRTFFLLRISTNASLSNSERKLTERRYAPVLSHGFALRREIVSAWRFPAAAFAVRRSILAFSKHSRTWAC